MCEQEETFEVLEGHPVFSNAELNEAERLQLEQASRGCISGDLSEWPALSAAILTATGSTPPAKTRALWLKYIARGILNEKTN